MNLRVLGSAERVMHSVVSEWGRFRPIFCSPRCGGGYLRHSTQTPPLNATQAGAAATRSSQTRRRMLSASIAASLSVNIFGNLYRLTRSEHGVREGSRVLEA